MLTIQQQFDIIRHRATVRHIETSTIVDKLAKWTGNAVQVLSTFNVTPKKVVAVKTLTKKRNKPTVKVERATTVLFTTKDRLLTKANSLVSKLGLTPSVQTLPIHVVAEIAAKGGSKAENSLVALLSFILSA